MEKLSRMYEGMSKVFAKHLRQAGQTVVEYALLLALIAVVAIAVINLVGQKTKNVYNNVQQNLNVPSGT